MDYSREDYVYVPVKDLTAIPAHPVLLKVTGMPSLVAGVAVGYGYHKAEISREETVTRYTLDGVDVSHEIVGKTLSSADMAAWMEKGVKITSTKTGKMVISQPAENRIYGEYISDGTIVGYYEIPTSALNDMDSLPEDRPVLVKRKEPSYPHAVWSMAQRRPSTVPGNPGSLELRPGSIFLGNPRQVEKFEGWFELPSDVLLAFIEKSKNISLV